MARDVPKVMFPKSETLQVRSFSVPAYIPGVGELHERHRLSMWSKI